MMSYLILGALAILETTPYTSIHQHLAQQWR